MPRRCVVYGCSNTADAKKNISTHLIPYWGNESAIAKSRRKKWIAFVQSKRDHWTPTENSCICLEHFTPDCFEYGSNTVERYKSPRLKSDQIGTTAIPTIYSASQPKKSERAQRFERRKVRIY